MAGTVSNDKRYGKRVQRKTGNTKKRPLTCTLISSQWEATGVKSGNNTTLYMTRHISWLLYAGLKWTEPKAEERS